MLKKTCESVLEKLCEEKVLQLKEYGKAKIYLANQENFPETKPEQLTGLDNEIKANKEKVDALQAKLK